MILKLTNFQGTFPLVAPHLLPDNAAQVASNVVLDSGDIMPLRDGKAVSSAVLKNATSSIYWYLRQYWLCWADGADVDVVPSPVPEDVTGLARIYWTDGVGKPKVASRTEILGPNTPPTLAAGESFPKAFRDLGVAAPGTALLATVAGGETTTAMSRSFAYVYTRVTDFGEESMPSTASAIHSAIDGTEVTLAGFTPEDHTDHYKLYRTNTGTNGTDYQLVTTLTVPGVTGQITDGKIPVGVTSVTENVPDAQLGALLRSQTWDVPLAGMAGLVGHPAGFMAAYKENKVYVTATYMPHAWPYTYTFYETIVGLATYGQSILVLTDGTPYTLTGVDPSALSQERLESGFACVSKRSIVDMGDNIVYASPYGLVSVNTDSIKLVTNEHLGKRDFASLLPAYHPNLRACCHDRKYIAFDATSHEPKDGFVFDFIVNALSTHTVKAACAFSDDVTAQLYYAQTVTGNPSTLNEWDGGTTVNAAIWKSKVVNLPGHLNFAGCRVLADGYDANDGIVFTVLAYPTGNSTPVEKRYPVKDPEPFPLYSGFMAARYEFQIESIHRIRSVELFNDVTELFNG